MKAALLGSVIIASPALAQTAAAADNTGDGVQEIVVTAQKRSEPLQKVPLAITAVSAADLDRSGIKDLSAVTALVPNLTLGQQTGSARIALRGIGLEALQAGAEGSIAFHVDGIFESRSVAALASLYDIERVEVLRGPQGTLYGRNATGGSINVITREPTENLNGYLNITTGNYGRYATEGALSGALVPGVLLARISFQTDNHDGYGHNVVTGTGIDDLNSRSVRGKLLFTPTDRVSLEISADYHRERDHAGGYHYLGQGGYSAPGVQIVPAGIQLGGEVAPNVRDISNDSDPQNYVSFWGVAGKLTYDLGGGTQLRSLTAYRRTRYDVSTDLDGTNLKLAQFQQAERDSQFSEEIQLAGKATRLNWVLGIYYFHENDTGFISAPFNNELVGFPAPGAYVQGYFGGGTIRTDALAGFGQASYEIVGKLRLTLGARYSSEKKSNHDELAFDVFTPYNPTLAPNVATLDRSVRFNSFTPRIALDYQLDRDVLLYASWSRGFKAGTYNLGALQDPVKPEKVSAFEAGVKSTLFNHRLRVNIAGFHYDYTDLQVGKVVNNTTLLENAASATIYGLEVEMRAKPSPRVEFDANGAWLHARFNNYVSADPARPFGDGTTLDGGVPAFNLAGHTLSQSPNFTLSLGAEYHLPTTIGEFTLRGEMNWRDREYFTPFNLPYVGQAANTKVNAFLNWVAPDRKWNGSLFVKNLTNKTTVSNSYVSSSLVGFPVNGYLDPPRTFGASIGYRF